MCVPVAPFVRTGPLGVSAAQDVSTTADDNGRWVVTINTGDAGMNLYRSAPQAAILGIK